MAYNKYKSKGKYDRKDFKSKTRISPTDDIESGLTKNWSQLDYSGNIRTESNMPEPSFTKNQNYDTTVDNIVVHGIKHADPVYGNLNPVTHRDYLTSGTMVDITGTVERAYINDEYSLQATRSRVVYHLTQGINIFAAYPEPELSVQEYRSSIITMVDNLNRISYIPENVQAIRCRYNSNLTKTETDRFTAKQIPALGAWLLGYQTETLMLATFIAKYKILLSMIPLLKNRFYNLRKSFDLVAYELQRAAFRGLIAQLEKALRRNFINKTWLGEISKMWGYSSITNGIDSSVDFINLGFQLSKLKIETPLTANTHREIPVYGLFGALLEFPNKLTSTTVVVNQFEVNDIYTAALLDRANGNHEATKTMINNWLSFATKVNGQVHDWEEKSTDLKQLLHLLQNNKILNPEYALDVTLVDPAVKDRWERNYFIESMLYSPASEISNRDANGFTVYTSEVKYLGINPNIARSNMQNYYRIDHTPTNAVFYILGGNLTLRLRGKYSSYILDVTQVKHTNSYIYQIDLSNTSISLTEASVAMSDAIPYLRVIKNGAEVGVLKNPNHMRFIPLRVGDNFVDTNKTLANRQIVVTGLVPGLENF